MAVGLFSPAAAQTGPNAFTFVAFGDMPYKNADIPKVDRLIAAINALKPAFTIHVGDIKSGSSPCTDAELKRSLDQINTLEQPVVYTIGDNDWTDCHRQRAGSFKPRERLTKLRELAFSNPGTSMGKNPMQVETQSKLMPEHAKFVENQRFGKNGVLFIVAHIVGSNNGFEQQVPGAEAEYLERNEANITWINDGFRLAKETSAKAVVIAFQANVYDRRQQPSGFVDTVEAIVQGARAFDRPVLVIHGDNHVLELEAFKDNETRAIRNTLRLQLFGEALVHAMRIIVDPDMPGVFGFISLIVPENGPF